MQPIKNQLRDQLSTQLYYQLEDQLRDKLNNQFDLEHIIPKSRFNSLNKNPLLTVNSIDNLFAACKSCNNYKHNLTIEEFRKELLQLQERLNKRTTIYRIAKRFNLITEKENKIIFYFEMGAVWVTLYKNY